MTPSPSHNTQPAKCCDEDQARAWSSALAETALEGDDDAKAALPNAIEHWLQLQAVAS
jgi:hypothetical protein